MLVIILQRRNHLHLQIGKPGFRDVNWYAQGQSAGDRSQYLNLIRLLFKACIHSSKLCCFSYYHWSFQQFQGSNLILTWQEPVEYNQKGKAFVLWHEALRIQSRGNNWKNANWRIFPKTTGLVSFKMSMLWKKKNTILDEKLLKRCDWILNQTMLSRAFYKQLVK